jgi:hypothetical protein
LSEKSRVQLAAAARKAAVLGHRAFESLRTCQTDDAQ